MADNSKIDPLLLKQFVPMNTFSDAGISALLPHVEMFLAQKGTPLFKKGDKEQYHFYLVSGKILLEDEDGGEDILEAQTISTKFAISHKFPRKASAKVADKATILRIESQKVSQAEALSRGVGTEIEVSELEEAGSAEDDWMSQLLRSRVFQLIPPGNIQRVMMCMESQEVEAGEVIIQQGDEGDYFYLINRGNCRVDRDMGDGKPPVDLARLGPGDSFGEDALLAGKKRSATITMLENGRLLRLSKKNFIELIKEPLTKPFGFEQAKALVDKGGVWLDVREQVEYDKGHLKGAINAPFNLLRFQADSLDHARHYVICCQDGRTSHAAAYLLASRGLRVTVLDKGLQLVPAIELGKAGAAMEEAEPEVQAGAGDALLLAQIDKLKQRMAQLEQERHQQDDRRVAELAELRGALDRARKDHSEVLTELLELKKEEAKGAALQGRLAEAQRELDQVRQEARGARDELTAAQAQLASAQQDADKARQEVRGVRDELTAAQAQLASAQQDADKVRQEARGGRDELTAVQGQLTKAQQEVSRLQQEHGEGDEALREQVKGYLEERLQLEEEVQLLRSAQKASGGGQQGDRALREEADRLRKELAQTEMALDAEVSARLEIEEELHKLKASMEA